MTALTLKAKKLAYFCTLTRLNLGKFFLFTTSFSQGCVQNMQGMLEIVKIKFPYLFTF